MLYETHITDLDELKQRLKTEWAKLDHVVIAAAIQWRRRYAPSLIRVLYNFFCTISHTRLSDGFNSGEVGSHCSCGRPSVETLVR